MMANAGQAVLIAALTWGAFAFGAVYSWALWPLVAALQAVAWHAIFLRNRCRQPLNLAAVSVALGFCAVAILAQLIPVPLSVIGWLNPAAVGVINELNLLAAYGLISAHSLSISPQLTLTGFILFATMALTVIGTAQLLSRSGARPTVEALAGVGTTLGLIGIVQQAFYSERIYGLWTTQMGGTPFGPFVNKNHFAGWMLMTLPLTLGLVSGVIAHRREGVTCDLRERVLWFGSPEANRLLLSCAGGCVMALALVMTMSRSGICAFVVALAITSMQVLRRQRTMGRKVMAMIVVLGISAVVVGWIGLDAISARFAAANWEQLNERRGAWEDAISIAARFPLAGTGLNTYGVATLFYQRHNLTEHYAQAHNDFVQLAAEGGALLAIPIVIAVVVFIRAVRHRFADEQSVTAYWLRVGAVTGLVAIALQETVEFSLQIPGNAALFAVLCGIALHHAPVHGTRRVVTG